MNNTTEQISIYTPKYETESIQFDTPTPNTFGDIADIQNFIREKAEKNLERCKHFEISLPVSITGITDESNRVEFKSLFQTPTLNDLEIVSTNSDGSSIKLNNHQLQSVKQTGEFEVNSLHFPGQNHRWKLSTFIQSGIQTANQAFFKDLSWAVYMLIIFARDRIESDRFSFKSTIQSWKRGFINLLDILIGLPATTSNSIEDQIENERKQFLVMELTPNKNEEELHKNFCEQLPILLEMMEYNANKNSADQKKPSEMLPYAHHFLAPNNIIIDLRLYNPNLQYEIRNIITQLLADNTPKHWFNTTKRRLINEYKNRQVELGLTKDDIAKRIQIDLNNEYTAQIFEIIEKSGELESLSPGLGGLLVAQARVVLTMKSVVEKLNEDLELHLKLVREKLIHDHPIKSKINRWIDLKISNERMKYIQEHQWDAHQLSIDECQALGNHQAAYFIQRDLLFRRDHETNLRQNFKPSIQPIRTIYASRFIWFPSNWIVERTYPLPIERIPVYFANKNYSLLEEEERTTLIDSNPDAHYQFRQNITYEITTQYPFWRWKLFAIRNYCWLSNAMFYFCLVVPFISPVSFRALFSKKPFTSGYYFERKDLKLHGNRRSITQTFISRLIALWNNIRISREKFERTPDRGLLGKNMQRMFNRIWNYIGKGLIGTVAVCAIYPIACLSLSTISFILGILSPIWMPVLTLVFHIGEILIYDADSAGEYGRKLFNLINIILADFVVCGILQPILVLISFLASPIMAVLLSIYASLHRCARGFYDTIFYHLIIKRFARVPAHDSFLARRISGPGLASEYFYQVSSVEVLAALESLIEQNQLNVYSTYVQQILLKPIQEYQNFFNLAFQPFAGRIETGIYCSVYDDMNKFVNEKILQLQGTIRKRNNLLELQRGDKHHRIRLTEHDLTAVLIEGSQLVEKWYPTKILPYIQDNNIEKFWNDLDLDLNDWFGLTNKLLQELFCREILTPLEQTDVFYSLKVDHLTLTKYAQMINSANLHDDLDVVNSVYMPETSYAIQHPSFDQQIFNPIEYGLESRNYTTYPKRFPRFNRSPKPDNYLTISSQFSIPISLPEIAYINIIIYKQINNNSTTILLKNISSQEIIQLIEQNKRFYNRTILPKALPSD